jgi:hypothetical protein
VATDDQTPQDDTSGERLPEEIDVEELVAEVRAGLHAEEVPAEEELPPEPISLDRHIRAMTGTADVLDYRLSTGKSFATGVLALKRVVEAIVRPYAGHFLDQQTRFNRNVLQAVQYLGRSLDEIKRAISEVGDQQEQIRALVDHHVQELRGSLGQISAQFDEQYDHIQRAISGGFAQQGERIDALAEVSSQKMHMLKMGVQESIEVALTEVEAGFKQISERSEEDRQHLEAEIGRNIEAVLELVAELTADLRSDREGERAP